MINVNSIANAANETERSGVQYRSGYAVESGARFVDGRAKDNAHSDIPEGDFKCPVDAEVDKRGQGYSCEYRGGQQNPVQHLFANSTNFLPVVALSEQCAQSERVNTGKVEFVEGDIIGGRERDHQNTPRWGNADQQDSDGQAGMLCGEQDQRRPEQVKVFFDRQCPENRPYRRLGIGERDLEVFAVQQQPSECISTVFNVQNRGEQDHDKVVKREDSRGAAKHEGPQFGYGIPSFGSAQEYSGNQKTAENKEQFNASVSRSECKYTAQMLDEYEADSYAAKAVQLGYAIHARIYTRNGV